MGAAGDLLARLYSHAEVGNILVGLMSENRLQTLLDLGAGKETLSGAALAMAECRICHRR